MKLVRKNISSGGKLEPIFGYSRAVKVGQFVFVSGTGALDAQGKVIGIDAPNTQTVRILKTISHALHEAGAQLEHVVRTRIFVTNISHWEEVGKAHSEIFGTIRPASCLVQVQRFVVPEMLVEIEADAVIT